MASHYARYSTCTLLMISFVNFAEGVQKSLLEPFIWVVTLLHNGESEVNGRILDVSHRPLFHLSLLKVS